MCVPVFERAALISEADDQLISIYASDSVKQAISDLDHPFNFGYQADREAIGRTDVDNLRAARSLRLAI